LQVASVFRQPMVGLDLVERRGRPAVANDRAVAVGGGADQRGGGVGRREIEEECATASCWAVDFDRFDIHTWGPM
jgi:hypothetical protein